MKDRSIEALAAIMLIFIFPAYYVAAFDDGAYSKTIVDSAGRTISIPLPVERIIVLNSDAAEAVVTLGAGDRIVGITEEILGRSSHLPDLKDKQVVGTGQMGGDIDYELIGEIATAGQSDPSDLLVIGFSGVGKDYGAAEVEKKLAPFGMFIWREAPKMAWGIWSPLEMDRG
jgi:iron complex transport system substrate-binding protein